MFRRFALTALCGLLLGLPVTAQAGSSTPAQAKESGSPISDQGSNYNYRSNITHVTPHVPGLGFEVLEFADRLVLKNHTGKTVTVYGYQGEPYARVLANGTVEVNTSSPAYYLNQNFYGEVNVPASAAPTATPHWMLLDRTAQIEWHDHRIHYMSPALPPQVKDKGKRTKIFDWQVPISVGARRGAVDGVLLWVPEEGTKTPTAAILALVVVVLAAVAFVLVVRRRRGSTGGPPGPHEPGGQRSPSRADPSATEAW